MAIVDKIRQLTQQLYPTGRAFRIIPDGYLDKLHSGLAVSEAQAFLDALSILDSAIPDNDNFTVDDATDWERRLGITNSLTSLANRKLAISRKMGYGLDVRPRGSYLFLQRELQAAGFDVYVYENTFVDGSGGHTTKTIEDVFTGFYGNFEHGEHEHGEYDHGDDVSGEGDVEICVNRIDANVDFQFDIGSNLRSTFFIGGGYIGQFADVELDRKNELRELVLKIKPAQTVAYLFINFI